MSWRINQLFCFNEWNLIFPAPVFCIRQHIICREFQICLVPAKITFYNFPRRFLKRLLIRAFPYAFLPHLPHFVVLLLKKCPLDVRSTDLRHWNAPLALIIRQQIFICYTINQLRFRRTKPTLRCTIIQPTSPKDAAIRAF